tara:strand:+ start:4650 stop:5738 length:1089 start_codon:yes stop_codon:yes gene_type:complete
MKKQIALAMGLAVISGSAFASKARLQALGESTDGSQYISDNRNIFLNAAHVNYHKDMVTFEAGDQSNTDATATPNAEGGFLKANNNMVYGLYFGADAGRNDGTRTALTNPMNVWDAFVGGDAGVQWGVGVTYGSYNDEQQANEEEASLLRTRLGVISGDIEGFANITLTDTQSTDGTSDFEMKSNYDLGVNYNQGDMTYLARVMNWEAEDGDKGDESIKYQGITVGAARLQKFNNMATMNYKLTYNTSTQEGTNYTDTAEEKNMSLNAVIGLEVQVKEWLALRASISQDILNEEEDDNGDKIKNADATNVNAGASLVFGDLQIDGVIGNSQNGTTFGDDTATGEGVIRTDALMSRVSATYRF